MTVGSLAATYPADIWRAPVSRDLDFSAAEVQMLGTQGGHLGIMQTALRNQGFRKIRVNTRIEQLLDTLTRRRTDLIIVDVDEATAGVCELVRDIRFRRVGTDPFVAVFAVSARMEEKSAPLVLGCGADDILLSPISSNGVRARLHRLVEARKPFVATPSYIGPDRRTPDRTKETDVPLLDVPHSLRQTVKRDRSDQTDAQIEKAFRAISRQQVARLGVAVRSTTLRLENQLAQGGADDWREQLKKLSVELEQLIRHLNEQSYDDFVRLLVLLETALQANLAAETLSARRLEVLRLHGDSLLATLLSRDEATGREVESGLEKALAVVGRQPSH